MGPNRKESVETLIKRAANGLCFVSEKEMITTFVQEGVAPEQAWLIVQAAICYLRLEARQ